MGDWRQAIGSIAADISGRNVDDIAQWVEYHRMAA
jgi:hypothetical protein